MIFYKTQEAFHDNKVTGDIDLRNISRVQRLAAEDCDGRECVFVVTADKPHMFSATNEYEAAEWVRVLSLLLSVKRHRATTRSLISGSVIKVAYIQHKFC